MATRIIKPHSARDLYVVIDSCADEVVGLGTRHDLEASYGAEPRWQATYDRADRNGTSSWHGEGSWGQDTFDLADHELGTWCAVSRADLSAFARAWLRGDLTGAWALAHALLLTPQDGDATSRRTRGDNPTHLLPAAQFR